MGFWDDARAVLGLPVADAPDADYQAVADHLQQRLRESTRADPSLVVQAPPLPPAVPGVPYSGPWGGPLPGQSVMELLDPHRLVGGRLTWDDQYQLFGAGANIILPPSDARGDWRSLDMDGTILRRLPVDELLQILADASPDVSRALWDFLRLCNPGWEAKAFYVGTDRPNQAAQALIDDFMAKLKFIHGTPDVVINRLFFSAYIRGALLAELVLDEDGRTPLDLATPDPATIRFQRWLDPVLGQVWVPGQYQGALFVPLTRPTIRYIPVDPAPGIPYGRSPAIPAIFASLFLLGLLHDLRRVVAQQGYPRLDISIMLDQLRAAMPPTVAADPAQWKAWVEQTVDEVKRAYADLKPDDAFIHTSVVEINRPVGAAGEGSLAGIDAFIGTLERMTARALKTMPILMGSVGGGGGGDIGDANRQWEIEAAGIKATQHLGESMLEQLLQVGVCEAQGMQADVQFRFAELRAAEMFRDEQTMSLKLDNAFKMWAYGYADQDEAADHAVGHKADEDKPVAMPGTGYEYQPNPPTPPAATGGGPNVQGRPQRPGPGAPDNKDVADSQDKGDNTPDSERAGWGRLHWPPWRRPTTRRDALPLQTVGSPMATAPEAVTFDARDQRALLRLWDESMPAYAGLLDARVLGTAPEPPPVLEPSPDTTQPAPIRTTAEALTDVAQQMRELVAELRTPVVPPPNPATSAPPVTGSRIVHKTVNRDKDGRISGVTEVIEDAAPASV